MPDLLLYSFLQFLIEADTRLFLQLNAFHSTFWDSFMYLYSSKEVWVPMYLTIVYMIVRNFSLRTSLICIIACIMVIVLADQITASLIRPLVCRIRPGNAQSPICHFVHVVNNYRGGKFGFPSAHASNSFGLAFFVIFLFRKNLLSGVIAFWAIVNCYSRIYLGVHYFGDLFCGMFIGLFTAWGMYAVIRRHIRSEYRGHVRAYRLPPMVWAATIMVLLIYSFVKVHL